MAHGSGGGKYAVTHSCSFSFFHWTTEGFVSSLFGIGLHMFCFSPVWGNATIRKLVPHSITCHGLSSVACEWKTYVIHG